MKDNILGFYFTLVFLNYFQKLLSSRGDPPPSRSSPGPPGAELCFSSAGPPKESAGKSSQVPPSPTRWDRKKGLSQIKLQPSIRKCRHTSNYLISNVKLSHNGKNIIQFKSTKINTKITQKEF